MELVDVLKITVAILTAIISSKWIWVYVREKFIRQNDDDNYIKHDYRERILKLEALLERSAEEKRDQTAKILSLEIQLAELKTEIHYLKSNDKFKCYYQDFADLENENLSDSD